MSISAQLVMELRRRTGAGMMECKKFLSLAGVEGDIEKAILEMRCAGQAKADKKADRIAAEGVVVVLRADDGRSAVIVEVNSETDFVARDKSFTEFAQHVAETALLVGLDDVSVISNTTIHHGAYTVEEVRRQLVVTLGENIKIRRIALLKSSTGTVGSYLHGSRIGVLVALTSDNESLAKDIAMHVAASCPLVISRDEVSAEAIQNEREVFMAQAKETGKPQDIVDRMIEGRIAKFVDEVSLLGQSFVKDPSKKVSQLLDEQSTSVSAFIRLEVGEGIEKKEDNFVAEVMAQVRDAE